MTALGIPVPPGFIVSTFACKEYLESENSYPPEVLDQIKDKIKGIEFRLGKTFGDPRNPLLFSVRSGAAVSMPGMMDTVLNLGLNDETVKGLASMTGSKRFAYDSYRRFINMFGEVVLGIEHKYFEQKLDALKKRKHASSDTDLDASDLVFLCQEYKDLITKAGKTFPTDPYEQLRLAIHAVFDSWNGQRAIAYRKHQGITGLIGTAVTVQAMVFGNLGQDSGTGVCFTRDPSTGENIFYGEFLMNAQGEDVVAGIRTPQEISLLKQIRKENFVELVKISKSLERHYKEVQDIEFTIQQGTLWFLQTRKAKRTAAAAVKTAYDMMQEGLISEKEALLRISPEDVDRLLHPQFDASKKLAAQRLTTGLAASPGAAVGQLVFSPQKAEELHQQGKKVVLVRSETSPEDISGMIASQAILTSRGGMTSHAAVVARGMGKPCVCGASQLEIDEEKELLRVDNQVFTQGEFISLDGSTGEVFLGSLPLIEPEFSSEFNSLMSIADKYRKLTIRTNADTPKDSLKALELGAEGIGLCRTEHMFFDKDRINLMRRMILSTSTSERKKFLDELLVFQEKDFFSMFSIMNDRPVTIRLLDPPLHEFLPSLEELGKVTEDLGIPAALLQKKIEELKESNPMLGHRGCRLLISYPEIVIMQTKAIIASACNLSTIGKNIKPEIMVPLVGTKEELSYCIDIIHQTAKQVMKEHGCKVPYTVGTMIEVPRSALTAHEVAEYAEFFSFGTNDLTQMTYGFSRDDIGSFIGEYQEKNILFDDPFKTLDVEGVGQLVKQAVTLGRQQNNQMKMGVCGEHGGDPKSIRFFHSIGLDYVSCSPYRVPIARLVAAQASLQD